MTLTTIQTQGATIRFDDGSTIVFDATLAITPNYDAAFSQYPTESGRPNTSHIQLQNPTIPVVAVFTDTPLRAGEEAVGLRAQGLYERLLEAHLGRVTMTLVTTRGVFESVGIKHIDAPYTSATGTKVDVNILFERVVRVRPLGTVIIPDRLLRSERRRRPPPDPGNQSGLRDQDAPRRASLAKRILDEQTANGNVGALSRALGI